MVMGFAFLPKLVLGMAPDFIDFNHACGPNNSKVSSHQKIPENAFFK
jgi:hypothetical protein